MRATLDNQVMSSMLLWMDHTLLDKGEAFTNVSGSFYRIKDIYNGYYTYALPFKQIIADSSIPNANILSGIYLNSNFITTGQSGFAAINYDQGQIYFTQSIDSQNISGRYSIKDYNINLTSEPEHKLLFETKYEARPRVGTPFTGLSPQTKTYPVIFLKHDGRENEPFAFGGIDNTIFYIRAIIISDSEFTSHAVQSILVDKVRTFIPLIEASEMPYDSFGNVKNNNYNYNTLIAGKTNGIFIDKAVSSNLTYGSAILNDIKNLNPNIFPSVIDFQLSIVRQPRLA